MLRKFVDNQDRVPPMQLKNISQAVMEITFRLPLTNTPSQPSPGLAHICLFLDRNFDKLAVFDDIKPYFEELPLMDALSLINKMIPRMIDHVSFLFILLVQGHR